MAVDIFLKIDGIQGESQDSKHKDEIDVLSWSWGVTQSASTHTGGGGGAGKADFHDVSITKHVEKSSARILSACATGEHIKTALLTFRKAGKEQQEYLKIQLDDLIVSSVSTGGSRDEVVPTENVSLNFAKVKWDYRIQNADGSLGANFPFGYDIKANKTV